MPDAHPTRPPTLKLESLEHREVPTAAPWAVESFEKASAVTGLPAGWSQWSSDRVAEFHVDAASGLGDQGRLVTMGSSGAAGRAWVSAPYAADVETSAAVFLNSTVPVQLLVRGSGLNTATPNYYAATAVRGGQVQLVKVVHGQQTVLGTAQSADWVSNKWVTVTVRAEGTKISAFVFRGDTNQYLTPAGKWTQTPTAAVSVSDTAVRGGGNVGFARPANVAADAVALDSLKVGPADGARATIITQERFDETPRTGLPSGWTQWAAGGTAVTTIPADQTLRITAGSTVEDRAWMAQPAQADVQVSASVYVDSLTPAGLIARGSNLSMPTPTYYALTVSRGLDVELWKVVGGKKTELGQIRSKDWLSGSWVQASLVLTGDKLRVQIFRSDTGQYLDANGAWGLSPAWAMSRTDGAIKSGGKVGLSRGTGYAGPLVFDNFVVTTAPSTGSAPAPIPTEGDKPTVPPPPPPDLPHPPVSPPASPPPRPVSPPPVTSGGSTSAALPDVPQHYDWIRLANLAYYGTPMDSYTKSLLRNSVDLVIPNTAYLGTVAAASPDTPQFVYTNVSNIYLDLLTDWDAYADAHNISREAAFYHVTQATAFSGASASSAPVNQFWAVYRGSDSAGWTDATRDATNTGTATAFAARGQALDVGYPEQFREINVDLKTAAGSGWAAQLEYVAAVDSQGRPTLWKSLATLADTTGGLKKDGQVTFNPPADWVAASVNGSARLFYVRFRTTAAGTAPTAVSVTGRNFTAGGVIPAFDSSADKNHDGYLDDAEYAKRKPGMNARFAYESRLFYPNYGPMRYATNVSNSSLQAWAVDYAARAAAAQPLAAGFFVDNSSGRLDVDPTTLKEATSNYAGDYGALLGKINNKLKSTGDWIIANTGGAGTPVEPIAAAGVSYLDEFALRPLSANTVQFDDLAASLTYRRQLSGGRAYEILDSLPTNGVDATDPRMQLSTLAMYYLLADPKLSFLMVNGGNEPASSWRRHWIEAVTYDVGKPLGGQTVLKTGTDPANAGLTYKVYERKYENALVLYKPLSYNRGVSGGTGGNTATPVQLGGIYRVVNADGSLGARVTSVSLRNGEGMILAKAT